MRVKSSNLFINGTVTLTVAAILTKILSAVYRVPFQNIVGDVGFYIYQQVYPLYAASAVVSVYGFTVIISKLSIREREKYGEIGVQRLLIVSIGFLFTVGLLLFVFFFFGSTWLAKEMNDPKLAKLIKAVSFVFLIIPFTATLRGYFQGLGNMIPTAHSQFGEQFIRVFTILAASAVLIHSFDLYTVGAAAIFGSTLGAAAGLMIMLFYFNKNKWNLVDHFPRFYKTIRFGEAKEIVKVLTVQGLAVCASSLLIVFMQLADSLNLYALLVSSGIGEEEAKELKGVFDRGQPLIQIGSVVATSMALSLVPLITKEKMMKRDKALSSKIALALRVSGTIGIGATVGLMAIVEPTNGMLFENTKGSNILFILSIAIALSSVIITFISVLQGLGYMLFPAFIVLIGFILKYFLNTLFVPLYGTIGAAVATNGSLAFILCLLLLKYYRVIGRGIFTKLFFSKVVLAALAMVVVLHGYLHLTSMIASFVHGRILFSVQALGGVVIGGITYLFVVVRLKTFTLRDLALLPFGSKLLLFYPKRR